jgi:hypothetical protein
MTDTTSNDDSLNDEKRKATAPKSPPVLSTSLLTFSGVVAAVLLALLIYVSCGGLLLFACKVAAAKVLPTNMKRYPYTNMPADPAAKSAQDLFSGNDKKTIAVPVDGDNAKNWALNGLYYYQHAPDSSFIGNYFSSICDAILNSNYVYLSACLNAMNSRLSEWAIIFLAPLFIPILLTLLLLYDQLYMLYLVFAKMGWFFTRNTNETGKGAPEWKDVTVSQPVNMLVSLTILWVFIVLIIVFTFVPPFAIAPYLITSVGVLISILSILSYKTVPVGARSKNISSIDVVTEVFSHYKQPIVFIYAIGVILTAFSIMGAVPGIAAIAAVVAMYYGTDVFNPMSSPVTQVNPEGYSFEGGGASLTRKLKQMSKSFSAE